MSATLEAGTRTDELSMEDRLQRDQEIIDLIEIGGNLGLTAIGTAVAVYEVRSENPRFGIVAVAGGVAFKGLQEAFRTGARRARMNETEPITSDTLEGDL